VVTEIRLFVATGLVSPPPPGWTPGLGLLSSADDGLTVMGSVRYADNLVLSPVQLFEVVSTHDLAQLPIWRWGGGGGVKAERTVFRGAQLWVLPSAPFFFLSTVISTQVHLGSTPKGTMIHTTRLKATARAPLGVASRGGAVWPHFAGETVRVRADSTVLRRVNPRVCSSE
jgi:hypothetical protein